VLHEAFLNSSVFSLIGSLVIGFLTAAFSPTGLEMEPFTGKLFYGALSFFLLDMGIGGGPAAQRPAPGWPSPGGLCGGHAPGGMPVIGVLIAKGLGLNQGDALPFMVLCASASYIAVPAAMRMTVPEAEPEPLHLHFPGRDLPLQHCCGDSHLHGARQQTHSSGLTHENALT
jgi:hypothetical protein